MRLRFLTLAFIACLPSVALADSFGINILSATYSTGVSITKSAGMVTTFRNTISSDPISDALLTPVSPLAQAMFPGLPSNVGAIAETDLFEVHTVSSSFTSLTELYSSHALAKTELLFSSSNNGLATVTLDLTPTGGSDYWSEGSISLLDVTTGVMVWDYGWDSIVARFAPPTGGFWRPPTYDSYLLSDPLRPDLSAPLYATDVITRETAFDASHQYLLTLYAKSQSQNDDQDIALRVSGLHVVPEPATLSLFAVGVMAGCRYRRRS